MLHYIFSVRSPLYDFLTIWQNGKLVGEDGMGNRYFEGKARPGYYKPRRWVKPKDKKSYDSSQVPPEWHGWLHHQTNIVPNAEDPSFRKEWQKPHISNKTGTIAAYRPKGHVLNGGQRAKASGDYEAWSPNQDI
ncbi:MAG TPA: NADH:ubiquinone oxidoreductase subunit NDUFA12 [Rhodospirillaceae bacterium]|nr:NADH:ubiquinone oxidoreductase subunit NDUFA12 [Rhodospirillaceae bacterium]